LSHGWYTTPASATIKDRSIETVTAAGISTRPQLEGQHHERGSRTIHIAIKLSCNVHPWSAFEHHDVNTYHSQITSPGQTRAIPCHWHTNVLVETSLQRHTHNSNSNSSTTKAHHQRGSPSRSLEKRNLQRDSDHPASAMWVQGTLELELERKTSTGRLLASVPAPHQPTVTFTAELPLSPLYEPANYTIQVSTDAAFTGASVISRVVKLTDALSGITVTGLSSSVPAIAGRLSFMTSSLGEGVPVFVRVAAQPPNGAVTLLFSAITATTAVNCPCSAIAAGDSCPSLVPTSTWAPIQPARPEIGAWRVCRCCWLQTRGGCRVSPCTLFDVSVQIP
jgi:hypothetical protein